MFIGSLLIFRSLVAAQLGEQLADLGLERLGLPDLSFIDSHSPIVSLGSGRSILGLPDLSFIDSHGVLAVTGGRA